MDILSGATADGQLTAWAALLGAVLGLAFLRLSVATPLTILLALDHGLGAPAILALRLAGSLLLAVALAPLLARWYTALRRGPDGRGWPRQLLARGQRGLAAGHPFGTFLGLGVLLNSYFVLGLAPTLRAGRRWALAGAILGEFLTFGLNLAAILGLSATLGLSPLALTLALSAIALVIGALPALLRQHRSMATSG